MQIWDKWADKFAPFGSSNVGNEVLIKVNLKNWVVKNISLYVSNEPDYTKSGRVSGDKNVSHGSIPVL